MSAHRLWLYDFYHLWAAGAVFLRHDNPYDAALVEETMRSLPGWGGDEAVFGFLQLPQTLWLYALLALLPFQWACVLWLMVLLFLSALTIKTLLELVGLSLNRTTAAPTLFAFCLFPFIWSSIFWGQYNVICLLALLLSLSFWQKRSFFSAGFSLAFVLFKPHLCVPTVIAASLIAFRSGRLDWFLGAGMAVALQTVPALLLRPHILQDFLINARSTSSGAVALRGAAPAQLLAPLLHAPVLPALFLVCGIIYAVWLALRLKEMTTEAYLYRLLPAGLLLAPYAWGHTYLLLLPIAYPLFESLSFALGRLAPLTLTLLYALLFTWSIIPKMEPVLAVVPIASVLLLLMPWRDGKRWTFIGGGGNRSLQMP